MNDSSRDLPPGKGGVIHSDETHPAGLQDSRRSADFSIEEMLLSMWAKVLESNEIGIHDNFIDLGGDSIQAVQIISHVRESLQVDFTLRQFFESPTIAAITRTLEMAPPLLNSQFPALPSRIPAAGSSFPLSLEQEGIWFVQQLHLDSTAFNVVDSAWMNGPLNVDAFRLALQAAMKRQAALRTTFRFFQGHPVQQVAPQLEPEFYIVEVEGVEKEDRKRRALEQAKLTAQRPFDLVRGPLWRLHLYRFASDEYFYLLTIHHIIFDDWSLALFLQDVTTHYNDYLEGKIPDLQPLPIQYTDFTLWQREWLKSQEAERHRCYWRRQLKDLPVLEISSGASRPRFQTFQGSYQSRPFEKELLEGLKRLSLQEGVTLFVTMLAAFDVLLYRYTNQEDLPVGVPMTNRDHGAVENLIGVFVNTHVIRLDLGGNPTFRQLLSRVQKVVLEAYEYKSIPFADIVSDIKLQRDPSRSLLYQVMFNFIAGPLPSVELRGIKSRYEEVDTGGAQIDLTMTVIVNAKAELISLNYNSEIFQPDTIARLLDQFETLLKGIVENADQPISTLPLITPADRRQLLDEYNTTTIPFPESLCIHHLFEAQVEKNPEAPALFYEHAKTTFRELNRQANKLAHYLRRFSIRSETTVAVALERSPEMVASLLAILKSGGACIPIDPDYPSERWRQILQDADVRILVTQERFRELIPEWSGKAIFLDTLQERLTSEDDQNPESGTEPDHLAVVHYTSGSTGIPKGVMGSHRGTVNRLSWLWRVYPFQPDEVCCANTPLIFVDSLREILGPLLEGIPLILIPEDVVLDPFQMVEWLRVRRVTRLTVIPALLSALLDTHEDLDVRLSALRYCFASGEVLSPALTREFEARLPQATLVNLYGCSEASGDSTYFEVPPSWSEPYVPIGKPIDNHQIFILDAFYQPVPIGVPGEIFIGGVGLAPGYLNHPELDKEKFIPNPFAGPGERMYRTGDRGCILKDGNIRYFGRLDRQIKFHGIRIELDEVEAVLRTHPAVRKAAVIAWDRAPGITLLIAYLVMTDNSSSPDLEAIRAFLRKRLPKYLLPDNIVILETMPLLPSGKVNRRALPIRDPAHAVDQAAVSAAPSTYLEKSLAAIWEKILSIEEVGMDDDFFELGGHSLLAARLLSEIRNEMGRRLPLIAIFQAPTIRMLARALEQPHRITDRSTLVRIQPLGDKPPFFCVHGVGGGVWGYEPLAELIGLDRPFYGFQARGVDGVEKPDSSIDEMAARYINALKMVQPDGPIYLGGYSYGGYVAYEMAQQLLSAGREIAALVMFDTPAPYSDYRRFRWSAHSLIRFAVNIPRWLGDFINLEPDHMIGRIRRHCRLAISRLRSGDASVQSRDIDLGTFFDTVEQIPPEIQRLMEVELTAFQNYSVRPYPGPLTLLRACAQPLFCSHDPEMGWGQLVGGGINILPCPGSHHTLLEEPFVHGIATQLKAFLDETEALHSSLQRPLPTE